MEEKAQKLGKSWKDPGRKIKIKNRSSFSQPKEVPLKGVVVFVTKKCEKLRNDIFEKVQKLGGQVRSIYDSLEVTHVIFVGKNNDLTKEFRLAREDGKSIVSPEWINMCYDENRKVEEVLFPHTYNPKMSLNMSVLDKPKRNVEKTLLEPKENLPGNFFQFFLRVLKKVQRVKCPISSHILATKRKIPLKNDFSQF